jgi:translation elongation factor EF-G
LRLLLLFSLNILVSQITDDCEASRRHRFLQIQTEHTLCDPKNPATLEPMVFPDPVISIAINPMNKGASEKMGIALSKMV